MSISARLRNTTDRQSLLIITGSVLLALIYCPPVDLFFDDKEIFSYAGLLIYKGGVPYVDLFDHKPPLIFFLNYFGHILGPWGLWIIDACLVALASLLFFRTCRRYRLPFAWLLPLLFNLLIRNYLACRGIGMTRAYTAIFLLLFFVLLMDRPRFSYFWMGILSALVFFMQQDQILALLPLLAYALLFRVPSPYPAAPHTASTPLPEPPSPPFLHRCFLLFAGFTAVTAIILVYFGIHHALTNFWQDAFAFNFSWYSRKTPFINHFRAINEGLRNSSYEMPLIVATALGCTALVWKNAQKPLAAAAFISLILTFAPELISGQMHDGLTFNYYLVPLSAVLPILVFVAFAFSRETILSDRKNLVLLGSLLVCLPLYNAVQHATHLSRHNREPVSNTAEFRYLEKEPFAQQHQDFQLYVFGNAIWVQAYNDFGILAPSPWIYHHFWEWFKGWDADQRQLQGIENDLLRHHTEYIIDYSPLFHWLDRSADLSWNNFLRQYYQQIHLPGASPDCLLWRRRPAL
jgi:hypothetical protein